MLVMLNISLYRLGKGFGYALGIDTAPEAMQLSKSRMHKETDPEQRLPAVGVLFFLSLLFLARESVKGERNIHAREQASVAIARKVLYSWCFVLIVAVLFRRFAA